MPPASPRSSARRTCASRLASEGGDARRCEVLGRSIDPQNTQAKRTHLGSIRYETPRGSIMEHGASRGLPPRDLTLMATAGTPLLLRRADEAEAPLASGAYSVPLPQFMKRVSGGGHLVADSVYDRESIGASCPHLHDTTRHLNCRIAQPNRDTIGKIVFDNRIPGTGPDVPGMGWPDTGPKPGPSPDLRTRWKAALTWHVASLVRHSPLDCNHWT